MIGVFDSGYGGLTILEKIRERLPGYDYLYLGDNARAPYGTRSFEVIYHYTLQAVRYLFDQGCTLVILACNTASAKALRTIQQRDLPEINSKFEIINNKSKIRNVLGVIRPTVEAVPQLTRNGHVGILATPATVSSESYVLELEKISNQQSEILNHKLLVTQQACPLWVPLIEAGEHNSPGADWFVDKYLSAIFAQDPDIDTLVLGCTHYPLLLPKIQRWLQNHKNEVNCALAAEKSQTINHKSEVIVPSGKEIINLKSDVVCIPQGSLVADSLADYLVRHPEYEQFCTRGGTCRYLTTESADKFADSARLFIGRSISPEHIDL